MLEWLRLKKCVVHLHSVTTMFLLRIKISWTPSLCCMLFVLQIKLLILSTEGFHRGTIWLKVDNLAALATNLPTLCQKICHENALYRPQIWVIRHWTTPMGRGSDWAISSAKNLRPVSDIQYCKLFSNMILSWKPTYLLCYQNKQWFPDYLAGTSRLGGVCVITGRSAIRGHKVGHYRSSECGGEEEKVESHPFGVSQVPCWYYMVPCSQLCRERWSQSAGGAAHTPLICHF